MTSVRTCIGCRARVEKTALVRIVADRSATPVVIVADVDGTRPGRGAHLHPEARCLDQARRRKAFARALRVDGPVDTSGLDVVAASESTADPVPGHRPNAR